MQDIEIKFCDGLEGKLFFECSCLLKGVSEWSIVYSSFNVHLYIVSLSISFLNKLWTDFVEDFAHTENIQNLVMQIRYYNMITIKTQFINLRLSRLSCTALYTFITYNIFFKNCSFANLKHTRYQYQHAILKY